jgi:hypothetical protein
MPANCPSCEAPTEDDWHWISCPARQSWRTRQAQFLSTRLDRLKTHPGLKLLLLCAFCALTAGDACDFANASLDADE